MDVIALTAFLTPFLPFLIKFGEKSAESVASKFGEDSWNKAKKVWDKLHPKVEAKEEAKVAAEQVAAKPDSKARQAVFQEELETLLQENPDLVEAITQIFQEKPATTGATQIDQNVNNTKGQVMRDMKGGQATGISITTGQGDVSL
jgi:transketolase